MPSQLFIVEDHPLMRRMIGEFIQETSSDLTVCGMAATGEEALEQLAEAYADLVLIDVSLPGMSGIDLLVKLRARRADLPCLMLSGHQEKTYVQRALAEGARGYLAKGNPLEIVDAIRKVLAGEIYLSESVRDQISPPNGSLSPGSDSV